MNCENCNAEHSGTYGSGRFCSSKCARSFSTKKNRDEISEKIAKSIKDKFDFIIKICPICSTSFEVRPSRNHKIYCSKRCGAIAANSTQERKDLMKRLGEEGKIGGWKARTLEPSYPEKYFISLFKKWNIYFIREEKIGKWFADFLIGNLVVEVDGSQHERPGRKKSDQEKDAFLISQGYEVMRIKWFDPQRKTGKEKLYKQIDVLKLRLSIKDGFDLSVTD